MPATYWGFALLVLKSFPRSAILEPSQAFSAVCQALVHVRFLRVGACKRGPGYIVTPMQSMGPTGQLVEGTAGTSILLNILVPFS